MEFLAPTALPEALTLRAAHPDAVPIMGGTDVMVELNFDRRRPTALLDLTRVAELRDLEMRDGWLRVGAGVTYNRMVAELSEAAPALAMAARTVGSPQIRNRGTIGGNLGAASPAGDCHPALLAAGAEVEVASASGTRRMSVGDFFTGVKRHAGRPDELVTAVWLPPASGPQQFSKIGTRNAMVISVAAFSLALHPHQRRVGTGLGSVAPTPVTAPDAEALLAAELDWDSGAEPSEAVVAEFGRLVAAAASPIDDVRGTAGYRQHAVGVLARRCLRWAWQEYADQNGAA